MFLRILIRPVVTELTICHDNLPLLRIILFPLHLPQQTKPQGPDKKKYLFNGVTLLAFLIIAQIQLYYFQCT